MIIVNDMTRDLTHPVWRVYDEYRSTKLSIKYYCCLYESIGRRNLGLEVMIAITASGSALAGLTVWQTDWGKPLWQVLAVIVATLAVAKPLLKYDQRIQQLQELIVGHRMIEHRLKKLTISIEERRRYDTELQKEFAAILDEVGSLATKCLVEPIKEKIRRHCRQQVEAELPASHFFVPAEKGSIEDARTQA
jgi:hypothetical protein